MPNQLHGTFSNGPACLNGQVLTFNVTPLPGTLEWQAGFTLCTMSGGNGLNLFCDPNGGGWTLENLTSCGDDTCCFNTSFSVGPTSVNCEPLQVVFVIPVDSSCGGPGTVTLTITL